MKGILIDDRLILRESSRNIDRDINHMTVRLTIEPVAGVILQKETLSERVVIDYAINGFDCPEIWEEIKDVDNEAIILFIFVAAQEWLKVYKEENTNEPGQGWSDNYQGKIDIESKYWNLKHVFDLSEKYSLKIVDI